MTDNMIITIMPQYREDLYVLLPSLIDVAQWPARRIHHFTYSELFGHAVGRDLVIQANPWRRAAGIGLVIFERIDHGRSSTLVGPEIGRVCVLPVRPNFVYRLDERKATVSWLQATIRNG